MLAQLVVYANAALFGLMGLGAIARPDGVVRLFGTPSLTREGRSEVRAVYGGFGLAIGMLLVITHGHPVLAHGAQLATGVALVGMAGGRLISAAIDRGIGRTPLLFLGLEIVAGLALAEVALR